MDNSTRRPLASRGSRWAQAAAGKLAKSRVTPNAISQASVAFAVIAAVAFWAVGETSGGVRVLCCLVAALGCQMRLVCNLLDGMVAVEGGQGAADGPLWNELPDRISDVVILVGVGLAVDQASLGWAAGALAVLTAYVRELAHGIDGVSDFSGPMAKPQRMAVVTLVALVTVFEPLWNGAGESLLIGLWIVVLGAALTSLRRGLALRERLLARR